MIWKLREVHGALDEGDFGHWETYLSDQFDPLEWFGFVYSITNKRTKRSYIGRKQLISTRRKKVKGRVNRKVTRKESNWKEYTGSCNELNEEIKTIGKDKYRFEILKLCKTKGELSYWETKLQFDEDVLHSRFPDGTRKYYNTSILNRWNVTKE